MEKGIPPTGYLDVVSVYQACIVCFCAGLSSVIAELDELRTPLRKVSDEELREMLECYRTQR